MQQAEGLSSLRILPRRGYPWWGGNGVVAGGTRRARRRPMNIQCRRLPEKHLPINYSPAAPALLSTVQKCV